MARTTKKTAKPATKTTLTAAPAPSDRKATAENADAAAIHAAFTRANVVGNMLLAGSGVATIDGGDIGLIDMVIATRALDEAADLAECIGRTLTSGNHDVDRETLGLPLVHLAERLRRTIDLCGSITEAIEDERRPLLSQLRAKAVAE